MATKRVSFLIGSSASHRGAVGLNSRINFIDLHCQARFEHLELTYALAFLASQAKWRGPFTLLKRD